MLKDHFENDPQVSVHHRDGFEGLPGLVPPRERRGLVLLDPAYEINNEFERLTEVLIESWNKWPTGIYAVWYPVQKAQPIARFHNDLRNSGIKKIYLSEISVIPDTEPNRLSGSGMIIINPPWKFDQLSEKVTNWLATILNRGSRIPPCCKWLTA